MPTSKARCSSSPSPGPTMNITEVASSSGSERRRWQPATPTATPPEIEQRHVGLTPSQRFADALHARSRHERVPFSRRGPARAARFCSSSAIKSTSSSLIVPPRQR